LFDKDIVIRKIIAHAGQDGCVCGQGDGWQGRTVDEKTVYELGGHVLGIGRAAAIAEHHELVAVSHGLNEPTSQLFDRIKLTYINSLLGLNGLLEAICNYLIHVRMFLVKIKMESQEHIIAGLLLSTHISFYTILMMKNLEKGSNSHLSRHIFIEKNDRDCK
jgi:hypothetical protein